MDNSKQFELIQKFVNNMKDIHPGISNVYIFETTDEDGNVTDIKYGMNLMTNTGFNDVYKTGSAFALSNSVKLYVGSGVSNFDKNTAFIETPLFGGLAADNVDTAKDYKFPIMFLRGSELDSGIMTFISRFGIVSYPTNITNYDQDTRISEYGIGTSNTNLWTHSHIYNDRGETSYITKRTNQTLKIYIYMCLSMYEHVIMGGWANDLHMRITTNAIMFQKMNESNIYTYKRNNILVTRNDGRQRTYNDVLTEEDIRNGIDSIIRNTTAVGGFTLWSQKGNDQGYIDGFIYQAPGFMVINPEYMPPENVSLTNFASENIFKASGFSDKIGKTDTTDSYNKNVTPPFTTFMDVDVNTFNFHTNQWDCACPFVNDNNIHYTNAGLETNYNLPLYYFANGEIQTAYLYENLDPTNPILKIAQGHSFMVACSKYWDQSTWINIVDFNNIPVNARNCRYWIVGNNSTNISPTRQTQPFELLESVGGTNGYHEYSQSAFNAVHEGSKPFIDIPQYNCAVIGAHICAINRLRGYDFGANEEASTYSSVEMHHMTYGKWLISFRNIGSNQIHTIDVSGLNDPEPDISVLNGTRTLEFTSTINVYTQTYRTESGTGLICIQSLAGAESILLTIGNSITSEIHPWSRSCCIYNTNLLAYIPTTDPTHIHVYDTTLSADTATIDLPTDFVPDAIFGNGSHLWFYNSNGTYHVDLSTVAKTPEVCNTISLPNFANSYKVGMSCVSDVTSVFNMRTSSTTMTDLYFIDHTAPTNIRSFSAINNGDNAGTICHGSVQLKYLNGHTLVAIARVVGGNVSPKTSRDTKAYFIDLGQYIKTGTNFNRYYWKDTGPAGQNGFNGIYLYGESILYDTYYLFPAVNMVQLKLTGKTRTISAFNHTKRLSDKTFEIGFTNMPLWGYEINNTGRPPGTPTPTLDGNGQIIGWS